MPKCLLKYQWVKLSRGNLPAGKGIMGYWAKLASRAAFRKGQAKYCGYTNDVVPGMWSGGMVGLKSILGVKSRAEAVEIMNTLQQLGYVHYMLDKKTKKLEYAITDWVLKCSGAECMEEYFPFVTKAFDVMQYTAWAVLFLIVVWQLFRAFGGPITEAESPWQLVVRGAIFALLIGYAKPIFMLALDIARAPYTALMDVSMTAGRLHFCRCRAGPDQWAVVNRFNLDSCRAHTGSNPADRTRLELLQAAAGSG